MAELYATQYGQPELSPVGKPPSETGAWEHLVCDFQFGPPWHLGWGGVLSRIKMGANSRVPLNPLFLDWIVQAGGFHLCVFEPGAPALSSRWRQYSSSSSNTAQDPAHCTARLLRTGEIRIFARACPLGHL